MASNTFRGGFAESLRREAWILGPKLRSAHREARPQVRGRLYARYTIAAVVLPRDLAHPRSACPSLHPTLPHHAVRPRRERRVQIAGYVAPGAVLSLRCRRSTSERGSLSGKPSPPGS